MSEYPEHDKMKAIIPEADMITNFIEHLEAGGIYLIEDRDMMLCWEDVANRLLAEYFGIDLKVIEQEKRQMLDQLRRDNGS